MRLLITHHFENLRLISEANNTDHWTAKHKRKKKIQLQLFPLKVALKRIDLPCVIEMVRIGPKPLDSDNLQMAAKCVRDQLSYWLIDCNEMGQSDNDPRITWLYKQEKRGSREYALIINIYKET
jgi:hypothetical protein